jgi:hypothetical protein
VLREQILQHIREEESPAGIFAKATKCDFDTTDPAQRLHDRKADLEATTRLPEPRPVAFTGPMRVDPAHFRRVKWQVISNTVIAMTAAASRTITMIGTMAAASRTARTTMAETMKGASPAVEVDATMMNGMTVVRVRLSSGPVMMTVAFPQPR